MGRTGPGNDDGVRQFSGVSRREWLKSSVALVGGVCVTDWTTTAAEPGTRIRVPGATLDAVPAGASAGWGTSRWDEQGTWPARWVRCIGCETPPCVAAYRLRFRMAVADTVRLRVSADERYELFLDGQRIGRGSERGNFEWWFYETYTLVIDAGLHTLVARVWSLGDAAPLAQFQREPGFLVAAEGEHGEQFDTGRGAWDAKVLPGYRFEPPVYVWGLAAPVTVDGAAFGWGFERGEGLAWQPVQDGPAAASALLAYGIAPTRYLRAGTLPAMRDFVWQRAAVRFVARVDGLDVVGIPVAASEHLAEEAAQWQTVVEAASTLDAGTAEVESPGLTIPPHTVRRILIDLQDYVCAYPELVVSGGTGSRVRIHWAEALRLSPGKWDFTKGHRDEIEGKYFFGMGDTFMPDGGDHRRFDTLWWACGRYVEVLVQTALHCLTIHRLAFHETRYPLEMESEFSCDDRRLTDLTPMLVRGMQACSHETFVDCPYFEQMQYVADARIEALCSYIMTRDDRLVRKALMMIDQSRHANGMTESRHPVSEPQYIPWFSLLWVQSVHDYAVWRRDPSLVRRMLPGVRAVLEAFLAHIGPDGLLRTPEGWNDTDASKETGLSSLTHWALVWTLELAAELEDEQGEPELAARLRRRRRELLPGIERMFWSPDHGAYADSPERDRFSELPQCLALLSGALPATRAAVLEASLRRPGALKRATVHSTHYLLESCNALEMSDLFFERLGHWFDMGRLGLKTPLESYDPSRSDCHAWASHPLYHYFATILGVRPVGFGFHEVAITPRLGPLTRASGCLVHPGGGTISVELRRRGDTLYGAVSLPDGVRGTLCVNGVRHRLEAGERRF